MKRFCQQCGQEAKLAHKVCIHCGTRLPELKQPESIETNQTPDYQNQPNTYEDQAVVPQKRKQPMQKKKKIILITLFSILGAVIISIIGLSIWAMIHFSEGSTNKRFLQAIENEDIKKLTELLSHEDGSSIAEGEAKALISLANEIGNNELNEFVSIKPDDKFLGIFQIHSVFTKDQYAFYHMQTDGLELQFNSTTVKPTNENDGVLYGPLSPGIYTVNVQLHNNFGESTTQFELYLADGYSEQVWMDELPISEADVYVTNYSSEWTSDNIYLLINGQKVPVNEYGEAETFGPIFIDGSTKGKVVTSFPWGEVSSGEFAIESSYTEVTAAIVSEENLESIKTTIFNLGEQMANAKASLSSDVLTSANDVFKEDFQVIEIDYLIENGIFYSGMLEKIDIDRESLWFYDDLLMIPVSFYYNDAVYTLDEEPTLSGTELNSSIGLKYNEETQDWIVNYLEFSNEAAYPTDTIEGSKSLYEPSEETIQSSVSGSVRSEIQNFMEQYTMASVEAVNMRSITPVKNYMTTDGPRYQEAKDYIAYLKDRNNRRIYFYKSNGCR